MPLEPNNLPRVQVDAMVHAISDSQAIDLRSLRKVFGNTVAVDDVSIQVFRGEIFGFMGHNGAGKTTTIRMLLGLLAPTGGSASVLGYDIVRESIAIRRLAGFLPDGYALPKEMTARRFLRYVGAMFGMTGGSLERQIDRLLERFDLVAVGDKRLGEFSSGMIQKVGLAQALINNPRVLLLDEPTAGLDPIGRHETLELIRDLAINHDVTALFSTHILTDIERICERVAILHRGRLIASGALADLKAKHRLERMDDLYLTLVREMA
jgi:ABC-2 type transport system ATP-binding protein